MPDNTSGPMTGPAGTAEQIDYQTLNQPGLATVSAWLLHCPGQSPAWAHYMLAVIHLRPAPGVNDPEIRIPGATHEVLLCALDPTLEPRTDDLTSMRTLHPLNVCEQVQLPSDDAALRMLALAARAVVDGRLPAEPALSGQVEPWRSTLADTAAHYRGEHG